MARRTPRSGRRLLRLTREVAGRLGRDVRRAPVSWAYAVLLLLSTWALELLPGDLDDSLMTGSSTDVWHLAHDPLVVLVASALLLPGLTWLPDAVVLLGPGRLLEHRVGSGRALLVMLSGHLVGTALTELPIAAAIGVHALPDSDASRTDVGASYALVALVVAYAALVPGVLRLPLVAAGFLLVAGIPTVPPDMTTWGHLVAVCVGLCWWPHLRRHRRPATRDLVPGTDGPAAPRVGREEARP